MAQALCILHANCQGEALLPLLENAPAFHSRFRIARYTNYTREHIPQDALKNAALFLYQRLGEEWGEISSRRLLDALPPGCAAICIPNLFFKGYWPTWTNRIRDIEFADTLVESLLARGLSPMEILHLATREDGALLGDAAKIAEDSIRQEETKEQACDIACSPILREYWRKEQLFLTVNHPGPRLLFHVADSLFSLLGLAPLPDAVKRNYAHPDGYFWLPLHPALGRLLHLPFATAQRRYHIFSNELTHREYVACYIACRTSGVSNLLGALRGLPPGYRPDRVV
ncbi:MAG: hypothetical protein J5838_04830 [Desulfovibrio sp.]|nr:hypothetical protein [Desulfovibrio sp.]